MPQLLMVKEADADEINCFSCLRIVILSEVIALSLSKRPAVCIERPKRVPQVREANLGLSILRS
jgi:hypothetical protein